MMHRVPTRIVAFLAVLLASGCGSDTVAPKGASAPHIDSFDVSPGGTVEPGMRLTISYGISDAVGVTRSTLWLSGAVTQEIETNEQDVRSASRSMSVVVPANARLDQPLNLSLVIYNAAEKQDSVAAAPMTVADLTPPKVNGGFEADNGYDASTVKQMTTAVGDNVRFRVIATDNHQLAWVGWRLGAPANRADSVAVSAAQGADSVTISATAGWVGASRLTIFARDAVGHLTEQVPAVDTLEVYPVRTVTPQVVQLAHAVTDQAYDDAHDRMLLLEADSTTVQVVSLAGFTVAQTITLPEPAGGLDVTPSGDSLLVTLPHSHALGVLPLSAGASLSRIAVAADTVSGTVLGQVRVAANGKALIAMPSTDGTYRDVTIDLGSGTQTLRTDTGTFTYLYTAALERSEDHSHILALYEGGCCGASGFIYDAARDIDLSPASLDALGSSFPMTVDSTGDAFLVGVNYIAGDLSTRSVILPPRVSYWSYAAPTAISPDGKYGYFSSDSGYLTMRLADQAVIEAVKFPLAPPATSTGSAPAYPNRFVALPGDRLVGWPWQSNTLILVAPR